MEEGERMIRCEGKTVFPWNLVLFKFLYLSPQSNLSQFPESTRATPNIFQLVGSRSCSWVFGCVPVPTAARAKKARTIKTANPPLASPSFKLILPPVTAARLPFHPPPFPRLSTSSHQPSPPGDPFHPPTCHDSLTAVHSSNDRLQLFSLPLPSLVIAFLNANAVARCIFHLAIDPSAESFQVEWNPCNVRGN